MKTKLYLVTGGNQGEALALVKALLKRNCNVCALDKNVDKLESLIKEYPNSFMYFKVDVADEKSLVNIKTQLYSYEIAAMFINASDAIFCEAEKNDLKTIDTVFSGNVYGTILCVTIFSELMQKDGKIIFLNAKRASKSGIANQSLFCSAKWAIEGFSQSVKKACEKLALQVYNIYCGAMDTEFWNKKAVDMPVDKPNNLINVNDLAQIILNNVLSNMDAVVGDIIVERRKNG